MKKTIIYTLLVVALTFGCTSKEQDEKIKNFWAQQAGTVMMKGMAKRAAMQGQPFPALPSAEDVAQEPQEQANLQNTNPSTATVQAPVYKPVKALLFLSPTCPWCKRLKSEGWPAAFRNKYQGRVELIEYDLSVAKDKELLMKLMKQHNMTRIGYPVLFVGNSVIQGYPLSGADEAVQKVLASQKAAVPTDQTTAKPANTTAKKTAAKTQKPYMQIVMEEPENKIVNTKASKKDRQAMLNAFANVQTNNKKTLQDIEMMFGAETQVQALSIINETERSLKNKIKSSASYKAYLDAQTGLLKTQEKQLNDLMQRNAGKIRSI